MLRRLPSRHAYRARDRRARHAPARRVTQDAAYRALLEPSYARQVLTRDQIVHALEQLDERLADAGCRAQLYLVGGAVMCLVLRARESTKDVDGWFSEPGAVRDAARRVAEDLGLPEDWLNDAAKAFIPEHAGYDRWRSFPHLDVLVADERTLFAMKCAAARTEQDADDIRVLASRLGVRSSRDALSVVAAYLPEDRLPVRTRLLLEEMLDDGE